MTTRKPETLAAYPNERKGWLETDHKAYAPTDYWLTSEQAGQYLGVRTVRILAMLDADRSGRLRPGTQFPNAVNSRTGLPPHESLRGMGHAIPLHDLIGYKMRVLRRQTWPNGHAAGRAVWPAGTAGERAQACYFYDMPYIGASQLARYMGVTRQRLGQLVCYRMDIAGPGLVTTKRGQNLTPQFPNAYKVEPHRRTVLTRLPLLDVYRYLDRKGQLALLPDSWLQIARGILGDNNGRVSFTTYDIAARGLMMLASDALAEYHQRVTA